MTRIGSDRRPYDIRPVSLIQLEKIVSQDALNRLSRYEEVNRQFEQVFPQMARKLERPWILWFLSLHAKRQEDMTITAADFSTSPYPQTLHAPVGDFALTGSAGQSPSMEGADFELDEPSPTVSASAVTTAPTSPDELPGYIDSPAPLDASFDSSCDLDALSSMLLWNNQLQEARYNHTIQNREKGGMEEQRDASPGVVSNPFFLQPSEQSTMPSPGGESSDSDSEALAEQSCVDKENMNQVMFNLNQLESRLRGEARRQLDVIGDDHAASPMCL
ncbi:hypothetical protein TARUN_1273 [Trichoderma arundinaceum]|uniref:Uncharacterized protein n=1 Tax=Trichoderma arundinaceum TaxID=490622 RepID=A0A395NY30_TRIAR|nr:hypothetical protein TARUN_1273 [Trichoderma arundinaceum]